MHTDPSSRSARQLVRLVILAVALPSLLLTGMGVVAIDNERAAAKNRLEKAYQPVIAALANPFNAAIAALPAASGPPLEQLVAGSLGTGSETDVLDAFAAGHPYAVNYFVLVDGVVKPWRGPRRPLPAAARELIAALEQDLRGTAPEAAPFFARVEALALALGAPGLQELDGAVRQLIERLRRRLGELHDLRALLALTNLELVATADQLTAAVVRLGTPIEVEHAIVNPVVGGGRRVVFIRRVGTVWAGFELAPTGFTPLLSRTVAELGLEDGVEAAIISLQPPGAIAAQREKLDHAAMEEKVLAWALLKASNLAWELTLLTRGEASVWDLQHNRAGLYLWALVLAVLVLVAGIVVTLRTVVREARFARLKTDFVSSVSHDLRTPLTSIRMFTETLLLGRVRNEEEKREALETIAQETERLTRLTARVLDFSRMEAGRKAYHVVAADLGAIVRRAVATCKPLADEGGVAVAVELADDLPAVPVDADAMVEVVINLLTNAIKYSPGGKRIVVRLRVDGSEVILEVVDHGIGIAKGEQQRIFEKFYRIDCRRTTEVGGSGLGLALVQHIVDAHRGRVVVESTLGAGSTFAVHLPAATTGAGSRDGADPRHRR